MLLLESSDVLRVVTDAAITVDVVASYVDIVAATGAVTVRAPQKTAISTAATTTIGSAPAAGDIRNVQRCSIRNRSAASTVVVTVQQYNGATAYELEKQALGPGQSLVLDESGQWTVRTSYLAATPAWASTVIGANGYCNPGDLMRHIQRASNIAATPTNITTSIARCSLFIPPANITFNRIRAYGVGATTSVFRVAVYRLSDLARLTAELAFTTVANTWVSIGSALNVALSANTAYFIACSVNATGTTAGPTCFGTTVAATTGQIQSTPAALPGSLSLGATAYLNSYLFQFAVTTGALPATAAALAAQAAWTGGMPAFFLDTSDT